MKKLIFMVLFVCAALMQWGCDRYADDYKDYLENREVLYPGLSKDLRFRAGNLRTMLIWTPSPDPNIDHYLVKWNNGTKSIQVAASTHNPKDSIQVIIPDLAEYLYSFTITAFDKDGNKSIDQQINNVRVYGPNFQSILLNRSFNALNPYEIGDDGKLKLRFNAPDSMNVVTEVYYQNQSGNEITAYLFQKESEVELLDYKWGTAIHYRSGYLPEPYAIDTIFTTSQATFPKIVKNVIINKAAFKELILPNDAGTAWSWLLPNIWDGSVEEPGYHTPDLTFPISFSLDMGKAYSLSQMKLWQRMSNVFDAGNPRRFEIYGSNAPAADGTWESWTKLGELESQKPSGQPKGTNTEADLAYARKGENFSFADNLPKMRYIRFKILETWGSTNYCHLIEISLYEQE